MIRQAIDYFFPKKREMKSENIKASGFYDLEREDASTDEHFYYANNGSADFHANQHVRELIAKKVRYEYANSSVLKGACQTRANTLVGKGPKLSITPEESRFGRRDRQRISKVCKSISKKLNHWFDQIDLHSKLRQMVKAKIVDGESFLVFLPTDQNELGLTARVFDFERVSNSYSSSYKTEDGYVDGIKYDVVTGDPISYKIMRQHPYGDHTRNNLQNLIPEDNQFNVYQSEQVFHWYRKDRGEQHRGVSELLSALPISAILRRVQKAVATSMETAASMSMGLYSELDTSDGDIERPEDWDQIPVTPNMMTVFPHGVKPFQMKSEHPNSEYSSFRDSCFGDIGRNFDMPLNRVSGSSADYNFSSAMIDGIHDLLTCEIDRDQIRDNCLDKAFRLFIAYGLASSLFTPAEQAYILSDQALPDRNWYFATEGNEIDPLKQTKAKVDSFESSLVAMDQVLSKTGEDIDEHFERLADQYGKSVKEVKEALFNKHMGLTMQSEPTDDELKKEGAEQKDEK